MKALIFGITGQDGAHLAGQLVADGHRVVGVARRSSTPNDGRVRYLTRWPEFRLLDGDVTDALCVRRLFDQERPDEVYNLAAQSHVGTSFAEPSHTSDVTYGGCLNCLESLRAHPEVRFYQASSSEMFGSSVSYRTHGGARQNMLMCEDVWRWMLHNGLFAFQDEDTPMHPNSPYAVAKLAAHHLCRVYRESYGLFACSGILFNHESPLRGETFVTRKITRWLGEFNRGRADGPLRLGNLDARRDWGHAADYVRGMRLMLTRDKPDDYVLATGRSHSVRDFLAAAFGHAGVSVEGNVVCDSTLCRPCEVPYLCGDAYKARRILGWAPEYTFERLVQEMVEADGQES